MLIFTTIFLDFLPDQMYYLYFVIPMQLLLSRSKNRDGSDWCQRLDNDLNNSKMTMYLGIFNCGWCLYEYHNNFTWMLHSYKILDRHHVLRSHDPTLVPNFDFCEKAIIPLFFILLLFVFRIFFLSLKRCNRSNFFSRLSAQLFLPV